MDYELKDDEGTLLDQSQPGQPLTYLHGHKNIIPGLEASLVGKAAGETVEVRVAPEDGYGVTNPSLNKWCLATVFKAWNRLRWACNFKRTQSKDLSLSAWSKSMTMTSPSMATTHCGQAPQLQRHCAGSSCGDRRGDCSWPHPTGWWLLRRRCMLQLRGKS